jgi:hypothetical protein
MNLQPQSEPRGGGGGEAFPKKRISKREIKKRLSIQPSKIIKKVAARNYFSALDTASNRYRLVGGRGFCLGAGKTRSVETA